MVRYDVIVVGAGPGGSVAAKTASDLGLKTVLFERGKKPGDKSSSGCGLSPGIFQDFDFMKEMSIPSLKIRYQALHMLDENLDERFMMRWSTSDLGEYAGAREFFQLDVYRRDFDRFLADLATRAGAELRTSTLVVDVLKNSKGEVAGVVTEDGERVEGEVTIAADGAVSLLAYRAGLRGKWKPDEVTLVVDCDFQAPRERMDGIFGPEEYCNEVYVSPLYPAAYVAMMPEGFHLGLGQWIGNLASGAACNPYEYLKQVIASKPIKRLIERLGAKPREFHAHLLPWMPRPPTNTSGGGIMLVGDAAGFPCPLEAEGIHYAMVSGKIAAEVAAEAVSNGDTSAEGLKLYDERWRNSIIGEEFSAAREWAELWAGIFFNPSQWSIITPLANSLMFWASWSNPHITNFKRQLSFYRENAQFVVEFAKSYIYPLLRKSGVPLLRSLLKLGWMWMRAKRRSGFDFGGGA
nr:NAD(P)/FAD-dependent oxidoreductase [Candidatus Freyarchaeota archaeon]